MLRKAYLPNFSKLEKGSRCLSSDGKDKAFGNFGRGLFNMDCESTCNHCILCRNANVSIVAPKRWQAPTSSCFWNYCLCR